MTKSLKPPKHTCFLFDQFAIADPAMRLFALHVCHVVASRIEAFLGPDDRYSPRSYKRTPLLYLVEDESFLDGVARIHRMYRAWLANPDFFETSTGKVVENNNHLFEVLLHAVEQEWEQNEYFDFF